MKDKGVHCEVESEGSRTQTLVLTNRNIILWLCRMNESAIQDEVRYYPSSI
ncbi:hypothetical protein ABB38_01575 [Staphylococcus pseudintermedius]|uniref:hypothetical protein n=1 Tax=Staphylococcus pseudintermedius TaxID=283734 RepID=UPI001CE1A647|nr:hypothetical protein [Staphylococcus pseudintermedius]MCA4771594.1 hypothetical protein [Staphylococcus pseudintermedius]